LKREQIYTCLVGYLAPALLWAGLALKLISVSHRLECCGAFPAERWVMTATFAMVLSLAVATLRLRPIGRLLAAVALNVLITLLVVSDLVHAHFFGDPASVSELIDAWQLPSVFPSIVAALETSHLWLFADILIAMAVAVPGTRLGWSDAGRGAPRWLRWPATVLALGLAAPALGLAVRDPDHVFEFAIGRRQVVAAVGLGGYHLYDIVTHVRYRLLSRWSVADADVKSAAERLRRHTAGPPQSLALWGAARGANLIVVQAESLQAFPIDLEIDGRPVMPNLRALARESVSAGRFFDQTAEGGTSDAAFAALQSLHPLAVGAVATRYPTNHYYGLPSILKEHGYDTLAAMGASGEFWNIRQLVESLGFAHACLDCPALHGLRFGQGLADGDFFRDVIPELRALREPFFSFLITVSNHHPYEVPEELTPFPLGGLANTLLGRYLQSVHYFDQSLGEFLRALADSGLLDRSVLVVYGDHHAWGLDWPWPPELHRLLGLEPAVPIRQWETTRRLPLLIRLPRAEAAGVRTRASGHLDVAPTLLTLLGIEAPNNVMLGAAVFDDRPSLVVFRNGGFVADGSYLLTVDEAGAAAGCYDAPSGHRIDCTRFEVARRTAGDELELSDLILRGDMIPTLRARLRTPGQQALSPIDAK
jgi:lipoteichoic acid synthase